MLELQGKLEQAEASSSSQPAQQDSDKLDHLVTANKQFEDHVASIDLQLEQTQQELHQTQQELAQSQKELVASERAALQEQTELVATQRAQHAQQQAQQVASKPLEEECVAKALQVCSLVVLVGVTMRINSVLWTQLAVLAL